MRKYGLTIDQLLSVDLVTADGELVTRQRSGERRTCSGRFAAPEANFGVVTEFEFRLNPLGPR